MELFTFYIVMLQNIQFNFVKYIYLWIMNLLQYKTISLDKTVYTLYLVTKN